MDLAAFVRSLPKAELHLHIEGSLEPEMMFALAHRNGLLLPWANVAETRAAYAFTDLQSFLDLYYAGAAVLMHEQDFHDLALAYFTRAHADGVVHAELFFDPQTHTGRGIAIETVLAGLERACTEAMTRYGISSRLIMCFLRHLSEEEGFATLTQMLPHIGRIHGVGLDSSEKKKATPRPSSHACSSAAANSGYMWLPMPAKRARQPTSSRPWTCSRPSASTMVCAPPTIRP